MGRTREFDIDTAVQTATDLFWRKGYERTSLNDLTTGMCITPTSFYFAFGSKEKLFRIVVDRYHTSQIELFEGAVRESTLRGVAEKFLYGYADLLTDPSHAPGCLVVNSALPCAADDPVRAWLTERRAQLITRLRKRFAKASELSQNDDPSVLARYVAVMAWGMAVEAQSGATRKELHSTIAIGLATLPIATPGPGIEKPSRSTPKNAPIRHRGTN